MSMILAGAAPVSKARQNAEQKQQAIVKAALALFLQVGYGATSMDAVAGQAGVTKQTVYRYYPSKEVLFVAVMERIRSEESEPYCFGDDSLETELTNFGRALLGFHLTPAAMGVYRMMLTEGGQENLLKPFLEAGPKRVMEPLTTFLQQRCAGLPDIAFHAQMFATMLLAPRNRLLMHGKGRMSKAAQKEHVTKVVQLFLNSIES